MHETVDVIVVGAGPGGLEAARALVDGGLDVRGALYHDSRGVHRLTGNPIEGPAGRLTAGMQELAAAMAGTLPAGTVRLGHPVASMDVLEHGVEVASGGSTLRASMVVTAIPPALAVESRTGRRSRSRPSASRRPRPCGWGR